MTARAFDLAGVVCSGQGEASAFTQLPWVTRQFVAKFGFLPHPGTLNLQMQGADWNAARTALAFRPGIELTPPPGFCGAKCFDLVLPKRVNGVVVFPVVPGYPADKFEIIAPVSLRQALDLRDGDVLPVRLLVPRASTAAKEMCS